MRNDESRVGASQGAQRRREALSGKTWRQLPAVVLNAENADFTRTDAVTHGNAICLRLHAALKSTERVLRAHPIILVETFALFATLLGLGVWAAWTGVQRTHVPSSYRVLAA